MKSMYSLLKVSKKGAKPGDLIKAMKKHEAKEMKSGKPAGLKLNMKKSHKRVRKLLVTKSKKAVGAKGLI